VTLVDELWSGVVVSGAPSVEHELALSHRAYVELVFAVPLILAGLLEAAVALGSDVWSRRRLVTAGQGVLAIALAFVAWTTSGWGLALGLALAGAASGVACGAAEATLVLSHPSGPDRAMVRWALFAAVGDVLAPLVAASTMVLGFSYRGAMITVAAVVGAQCMTSILGPVPPSEGSCAEPALEPMRSALARASRNPRLWAWLFAAASCTLLDELVVALAVLRMAREQGVGEAMATAAAVTFSVGSVAGAALTDPAVARMSSRAVLVGSCLACAASLIALATSQGILASCIALLSVGLTCAPHHALAQARAYQELPDRPGTVQAIARLFVLVDVLAPLGLGVVADRWGLRVAIGWLLAQPAIIVMCAAVLRDRRSLPLASGRR
jgi:MFS family permease